MQFFLFLLLLCVFANQANACSRRRRRTPPVPPTPTAPRQPATPPPIVKVVREHEQVVSRNNCRAVKISATPNDALASGGASAAQVDAYNRNSVSLKEGECLNAEDFEYVCEFTVYSEVAMTVIFHETGCGCAFTISVVKPRPQLPAIAGLKSVDAAYSTEITRFAIVVYDHVADQALFEIEAFKDMRLNANTTKLIEDALGGDPDADISQVTAGFAGMIRDFPELPDALNRNDPVNKNNIPAIMFRMEQKYTSSAQFVVPCTLEMSAAPNAYVSVCQPYRPDMPFDYAKRAALETDEVEQDSPEPAKAWFREFYLFPKQDDQRQCGNSGYTPQSRYITSFYSQSDCKVESGFMSIDREFVSNFQPSTAVVGGWQWKRTFDADRRVVFGVPHTFSPLTAVWCLGYSQITWASPSAFQRTQVPVTLGVCSALPAANAWTVDAGSDLPTGQFRKYKESHASYPVQDGFECGITFCNDDITLLGFRNRNPRDFSKQERSTLLTGPRRNFCLHHTQEGAERVVFDTLTFRGVAPGASLAKRNFDDSRHKLAHEIHMIFDPARNGLVHGHHAPELVHAANKVLRKRAEQPMIVDPVANPPHRDDFALNAATGSVDADGRDGAAAGDHPIRNFPETYSAPLTLDPVQSASDMEPLVYPGTEVSGVPRKNCNRGDLGCACRDPALEVGEPCDHPYECNTLNFCVPKPCNVGDAGCDAHSDGTCNEAGLSPDPADNKCVFEAPCTPGTIGCVCDAQLSCSEGQCLDSLCIKTGEDAQCSEGEAGCPCVRSDGSCNGGASCDEFTGLCLFAMCAPGEPGCRCASTEGAAACDDAFQCNGSGNCVQSDCVPGSAGCDCVNNGCNLKGFECVSLKRDNSEQVCVGIDLCPGGQQDRCNAECGVGNVAACGECTYSLPTCIDPTPQLCSPESELYDSELCPFDSATTIAASFVIIAINIITLF